MPRHEHAVMPSAQPATPPSLKGARQRWLRQTLLGFAAGGLMFSLTALLLAATLVPPAQAATRLVTLGGDITAITYALGAGSELVAVDSTSRYPKAAQQLPNVGYVRQLSAEGIAGLRPDLILATQEAGPPAVVQQLKALGLNLKVLPEARSADGIITKVEQLGKALHRDAASRQLVARLRRQADQLSQRTAAMPHHPHVVLIMNAGSAGLLVAGRNTAADAAIRLAGGRNAVSAYSGYKPLSAEALIAYRPEVLLAMQSASQQPLKLAQRPGVRHTPAGRNGNIININGEALLGFGVRSLKAALHLQEQLAQVANHD